MYVHDRYEKTDSHIVKNSVFIKKAGLIVTVTGEDRSKYSSYGHVEAVGDYATASCLLAPVFRRVETMCF